MARDRDAIEARREIAEAMHRDGLALKAESEAAVSNEMFALNVRSMGGSCRRLNVGADMALSAIRAQHKLVVVQ